MTKKEVMVFENLENSVLIEGKIEKINLYITPSLQIS